LALGQDRSGPCARIGEPDRLRSVTEQGEIVLDTGRFVRLQGLRLPEDSGLREAAVAWLRRQIGRPVGLASAIPPDRWGRLPARPVLADSPTCLDLAHGLLEAGLALVDPGLDEGSVRDLMALESTARERGLGLWADDRYKALPVGQVDRLRERIGHFALVEGRVRGIGERQQRTYLNFGLDWSSDFTIIIPKRSWNALAARGVTAATLKGRRIQARGILEEWQGPALTLTAPEMIEVLAGERGKTER
jgi:hypothetical protein